MTPTIKPSLTKVFEASEFVATAAKQSGPKSLNNFEILLLQNKLSTSIRIATE